MYLCFNYLYQFSAAFSVLLPTLVTGMVEGWTSVYVPQLLDGVPFKITSDEGSWVAAFLSLGGLIGCVSSFKMADTIGRKPTLLLTAIPHLISALLLFKINSILVLYFSRLIAGLALGVSISITPLYLGEISHKKIRGALGTCYYVFSISGLLFVNVLGRYLTIRNMAFVRIGLNLLFVATFIWMPESPYYLLQTNKNEEAKRSFEKLRGTKDNDFDMIKEAVREQKENAKGFTDIFKVQANRKALLILFIVVNGKQMSGEGAVVAYAQTIFEMISKNISPMLACVIFYGIRAVVAVFGTFLIERIGRKPMLLVSFLGGGFTLLLIGIYIYVKLHTQFDIDVKLNYWGLGLIVAFSVLGCFLTTMPGVVLSELFAIDVKTKASCLYGVYYFVSDVAVLKFFQATSDEFGMDVPFFVFSFICFVHFVLIFVFVFETKGKTLEEIQRRLHK